MSKHPKLVYIEWADAISNANWVNATDIAEWDKNSEWIIKMCGWLVRDDKECLVIALGYKPEDEWTQAQFVNIHKIPKTWIRKRKTIRDT